MKRLPHLPLTREGRSGTWLWRPGYQAYAGPTLGPPLRNPQHSSAAEPRSPHTVIETVAWNHGPAWHTLGVPGSGVRVEIRDGQVFALGDQDAALLAPLTDERAAWREVSRLLHAAVDRRDPGGEPLHDIEAAATWARRPLTVDGVAAMPHLPVEVDGRPHYWRGRRPVPAMHPQASRLQTALPLPETGRAATCGGASNLTQRRADGTLFQTAGHDAAPEHHVHIEAGRATLQHGGRDLRTLPLEDVTTPWRLLLGAAMGEDAADAWWTLRCATGDVSEEDVLDMLDTQDR